MTSGSTAALAPDLMVVVVSPTAIGSQAAREVEDAVGGVAQVVRARSVEEMLAHVAVNQGVAVALVMVTDEVGSADELAALMAARPALARSRLVLLTERDELDNLSQALDEDRMHEVIGLPWTPGALAHRAGAHVARWLREHLPGDFRLGVLEEQADAPDEPRATLLEKFAHDDELLTRELIAACERVLGPRPRLHVPAGVRLTHQGVTVDAVYVVVSGSVALSRSTRAGEVILHHATTGRIVGILSLASQGRAFVTSTTTSDVEVILLSVEQLDRALREDSATGEALAALLIRSLTHRLARAEILQVEKIELAAALDDERARLAQALTDLEQARLELLAQERFATLGELAAGVAHELNNPVAALDRATAHLHDHIATVLASHPRAALVRPAAERARTRPAVSTRDERRARRALERAVGDRETARRLVAAGVEDPAAATDLVRSEADLALVEAAAAIGRGERNVVLATERIRGLVGSLSTYVRPEGGGDEQVDVREVLEDALRLVAHRLEGVDVVRDYAEVPPVPGRAGELAQVWTNLVSNAADALASQAARLPAARSDLAGDGPAPGPTGPGGTTAADGVVASARLLLRVRQVETGVRVDVVDNGPGIAADVLPRIFEPRFTTRHGQVRFGLGLGMGLAKSVVDAHGGTITVWSRPGRTEVSVVLPPARARGGDGQDNSEGRAQRPRTEEGS